MLFTSPAFMFLFLPLATIFYMFFGKKRKKLCLGIICVAYHILLNASSPENLLWLPLLAVYTFFAGELCAYKKKRFVAVILGAVPVVWLIIMRQLAYYGGDEMIYPIGITMPSLCAAAYVFDSWDDTFDGIRENKGELTRFAEFFGYIIFFPIMILGPFLSYDKFVEITSEKRVNISFTRSADGIRYFATGFIKRIAIGAVLIDGYGKIFAYSWESPNLAIVVFLLVILYFGVFFSVSGYYDMSVGICHMFGVAAPEINANPFRVATANEYSKQLFPNVREWSDRYVVAPISAGVKESRVGALRMACCCICTAVFIRADVTTLLLCVPLAAFSMASALFKLDRGRKNGIAGLRVLFGGLTILVLGAFWAFLTIGAGEDGITELIELMSFENAEYQLDMILISFSGLKYLFVGIVAFILLLPRSEKATVIYEKLSERAKAIVSYGGMALMLIMFVFAVMFFLPDFAKYNTQLFDYITI